MDNDDKIVGRVFTRRQALAAAGRMGVVLAAGSGLRAAAGIGRPQANAPTVDLIASPALTQGPFYVTEHLNRSDLRGGSDRPSIVGATPLRLNLTIYAGATKDQFAPLRGAQVDVWHVDALGAYSDEPQGLNPENTQGEHWLRGFQMTDTSGHVHFQTVFPGWYRGRTTHIHFKVHYLRDGTTPATFTSQFFVPDDLADQLYTSEPYRPRDAFEMHNLHDPVYRGTLRDGTRVGQVMTLNPSRPNGEAAYTADFAIAIVTHPHPPNGGRRRA